MNAKQQKKQYLKELQSENQSLKNQIAKKTKKIQEINKKQEYKNSQQENSILQNLDQQLENL